MLNESSVAETSASPPTTGINEALTSVEVTSPSISRAKMTVKNGADDLTVSVNETATYFSEIRPSITVANRIMPTSVMLARNCGTLCDESGVGCAGPTPVSCGPYILIAPKTAVIVIWLMASTFGSALSVDRMCLLPKSVQPLKKYLERGWARAGTLRSWWCVLVHAEHQHVSRRTRGS